MSMDKIVNRYPGEPNVEFKHLSISLSKYKTTARMLSNKD